MHRRGDGIEEGGTSGCRKKLNRGATAKCGGVSRLGEVDVNQVRANGDVLSPTAGLAPREILSGQCHSFVARVIRAHRTFDLA